LLFTAAILIVLTIAGGILIAARPAFLTRGPRGEIAYTLFWLFGGVFSRVVHRVKYINRNAAPVMNDAGPMIVVANHTGGVDAILISAAVPFHIRWMMARETMSRDAKWFWNWLEIIPVDRDGRDMAPLREAIRYVREERGVIGIFPEGGIENPPGELRPFIDGVGLLITRTKAPVLLAWVSGTAFTSTAFGSVFRRSNARVEFAGPFDFSAERDPRAVAAALRSKLAEMSGWPLNDELLPTARRSGASGTVNQR